MSELFFFLSHLLLVFALGWYLIVNLQWYNYKIERVLLYHHKREWHLFYFVVPVVGYYLLGSYFWFYFYFIYVPMLLFWHRKLDKKLVLTGRVKRFFAFLGGFTLFFDLLCQMAQGCVLYSLLFPLTTAWGASHLFEKALFYNYKKRAKEKLDGMKDLTIVAITASYGKTSIKNFLFQILAEKYRIYATPRSVNTLAGIIRDINEDFPNNTQIYIVEAGARQKGDIREIAAFVNHHYAILGKVGEQHIEYFKSIKNIVATKLEILASQRLKKAFVHESAGVKGIEKVVSFGSQIKNVVATLNQTSFDLELDGQLIHFEAPVLGGFNALNITAAILLARELGLSIEEIHRRIAQLKSPPHRLQKIEAGGKLIIDDSFNGNLEGMLASFELMKDYEGRRVVVTPGLVESSVEANTQIARKIDEVFDLAIITGKLNLKVLSENIKKARKIIVEDKSQMQPLLAKETKPGDLILFANDAPSYV